MLCDLARSSPLAALMGQVVPSLFAQTPSAHESAQQLSFYPPGLSKWDPELGDQKPHQAKHVWTGNYAVTFLIAASKPSDAQSVLGKGMSIDSNLIVDDSYPVVLGFGTFENARSARHPFLGLNYNEFLAAIPQVLLPDPKYPYPGPYLYPYRLYLNRLLPTILGRLSGYPKIWERVSLSPAPDPPHTYVFKVGKLLTGQSLLELTFTCSDDFHRIGHFPKFNEISRLLIPNIVATGLLSVPIRSFFSLDLSNAVGWNVPAATLKVNDRSLFPVLPGTHTWKGIQQEKRYGAIRLYLPWQLTSADDPSFHLTSGASQPVSPEPDRPDIHAAD